MTTFDDLLTSTDPNLPQYVQQGLEIFPSTDENLPLYVRQAAKKQDKPYVAKLPGCYQLLTARERDTLMCNCDECTGGTMTDTYHAIVIVVRGEQDKAWEQVAKALRTNDDVMFVGEPWEIDPIGDTTDPIFGTYEAIDQLDRIDDDYTERT